MNESLVCKRKITNTALRHSCKDGSHNFLCEGAVGVAQKLYLSGEENVS